MKKFGTPIGAGPGSASEKVGLVGWGAPVEERSVEAGCCLRGLATFPAAPRTLVSEPWITS
jgi:hypothetical protein